MAKNRRVKMTNFEKLRELSPNPVDINDYFFMYPDANPLELIFAINENNIDYAPQCECGLYRGRTFEHHVCPSCLTPVESDFTSNFLPKNYVRIPEEMPPVIHPRFYILMQELGGRNRSKRKGARGNTKKQNVKIIDYILDPDEILPPDLAVGIHGQGFSYFFEHHDEIMTFLLCEHPKYSRTEKTDALWKLYQTLVEEENLFLRRIPLLNPIFHPMHVRGRSKTIDKTADIIMPVVINMIHTAYANKHLVTAQRYADRELWNVFSQYIKYIKNIMEFKIGDKQALVRRHCVAARFHFTGRAVISPILDRHMGDEMYLPWNIAMMDFQPEITNLLCNRKGYSPNEATIFFYLHINKYHPVLDWCFKTLIKECQSKGIPGLLNRNPTLIRESIRELFITKVKTDPNDKTINLSSRICKGFNADNDGDELNVFIPKEQGITLYTKRMHPREGILSETNLAPSNYVSPTAETFIHANEFLHTYMDCSEPCEIELPQDRSEIIGLREKLWGKVV